MRKINLIQATNAAFTYDGPIEDHINSFSNGEQPVNVSHIAITVRRTERMPLITSTVSGKSLGQIVDEWLEGNAMEDADVDSIHIELQPSEWQAMKASIRANADRGEAI